MIHISATAILGLFFSATYSSSIYTSGGVLVLVKGLVTTDLERPGVKTYRTVTFWLATAHMCSMGVLGALVWGKWGVFRDDMCRLQTSTTILFRTVPCTMPGLGDGFVIIYIFTAVPIIGLALHTLITIVYSQILTTFIYYSVRALQAARILTPKLSPTTGRSTLNDWFDSLAPRFWSAIFLNVIVDALFIADTEVAILRNKHLLVVSESNESDWTFGQTLSLILVILPLLDVIQGGQGWLRPQFPHLETDNNSDVDAKLIMTLEEALEHLTSHIYERPRNHSGNAMLIASAASLLACEAALFASGAARESERQGEASEGLLSSSPGALREQSMTALVAADLLFPMTLSGTTTSPPVMAAAAGRDADQIRRLRSIFQPIRNFLPCDLANNYGAAVRRMVADRGPVGNPSSSGLTTRVVAGSSRRTSSVRVRDEIEMVDR